MKKRLGFLCLTVCLILTLVLSFGACGEDSSDDDNPSSPGRHEHTFDNKWERDDTYHWHPATCGHKSQISQKEEHSWDRGISVEKAGCETPGKVQFTCTVCGATKDVTTEPLEHNWGFFETVKEPECELDGREEKVCQNCGDVVGQPLPRTNHALENNYSFNSSDHWRTCICTQEIETNPHTFQNGVCSVCGAKEGEDATNELAFRLVITNSEGKPLNAKDYYYTVTGVGTLSEDNLERLVIPALYRTLPVKSIEDGAFANQATIVSVNIADSVTSIGKNAFFACTNMVSVNIGAGVSKIGAGAFSGNNKLDTITVDAANAYYKIITNCLVETATKTLISACQNSSIPSDVKIIGEKAFFNLSELETVVIPSGVTAIADFAFSGCTSISIIDIPATVKTLGNYAFSGCTSLATLALHSGLSSIGDSCFADCVNLVRVDLPDGLETMGASCFARCQTITAIQIPGTVSNIGNAPFAGCTALSSITVSSANKVYSAQSNCLLYQATPSQPVILIAGCKSSIIPQNTDIIDSGAFYGHTGLVSITIPKNVSRIGASAFSGCTGLTTLVIESGDKWADNTYKNGLTTIGEAAFSDCVSLSSVFIPDHVLYIESGIFSGCGTIAIRCQIRMKPDGYVSTWTSGCVATVTYSEIRI